jgi:hypothetical protein
MPMSSEEGKSWIHSRVSELTGDGPVSLLDIGPGVGTYAKLLADLDISRRTGIEIWEPYVQTYRLRDYYDEIIVGDVRTTPLPAADVVILGDVVEHMTRDEAVQVWRACAAAARRSVLLSIPVVHYPQHDLEGNPYEVHVEEDWDHPQVLATFEGITAHWVGTEVGVYERRLT